MEGSDSTGGKSSQQGKRENAKTKLAFFLFGFVFYTVYSLILAASQDILSSTLLPTTVVLLAEILPFTAISIVCPFFIMKLKFAVKIVVVFTSFTSGVLLVSLAVDIGWKLVGVCLTSVGIGVGEMTILSMSAYYHRVTVAVYESGTGLGYITASVYYTGFTTFACVNPTTAILGVVILQPIIPLMYFIMDKKGNTETVAMATQHSQVEYTRLSTQTDEEETQLSFPTLPLPDKLVIAWKTLPSAYMLIAGLLSKYLSFQAVATILAFPDAPFGPRNHYIFYTTTLFTGVLIGRSYGMILLSIRPSISPYTKHTWIFSMLMFTILIFLIFAAWYRFVHSVWIVMSLMFAMGLLEGSLLLNTFSTTGEHEKVRTKTEFSRAFVQSGIGVGIAAAAFLGLSTETMLRDHCIHLLTSSEYCLTRSTAPWNATLSCLS